MPNRLTRDEFIARARSKNGDRYGYDTVEYVDNKTKVTILCREHGPFEQTPAAHMVGKGCSECGRGKGGRRGRIADTEEFILQAQTVHGDRYDYSRSEFIGSMKKLEILCEAHGPFWQTAAHHTKRRQGCPECKSLEAGRKKAAGVAAKFVARARKIHGDRYDYRQVDYYAAKKPVAIICKEHGTFEQTPDAHLAGKGCPACAGRVLITPESFLARAKAEHGDLYDYDLPEKITAHTIITVICEEHGPFEQRLYHHINGVGCGLCAGKVALNQEIFLERARKVHGDVYDYSEAVYSGYHEHLTVICREHGQFRLTPASHIHGGSGCAVCVSSIYERRVRYWLEEAGISFEWQWKHEACRAKRKLPFDFYLPDYNLLIEVDGQQHFEPVFWYGMSDVEKAEEALLEVQRRDEIKNRFAKNHGYPLLRIRYDADIEAELKARLEGMG